MRNRKIWRKIWPLPAFFAKPEGRSFPGSAPAGQLKTRIAGATEGAPSHNMLVIDFFSTSPPTYDY
jgi:hypothetical protein